MANELAAGNVNRTYSLGGTSIAIFTFTLFFLYPRFAHGEIIGWLFQATLLVLGAATFSFVFASFYYYYGASLGSRLDDAEQVRYSRRGDRAWFIGYTMLFLAPSLVLFTIRLGVGSVWFALWLAYVLFVIRHFRRVQTS